MKSKKTPTDLEILDFIYNNYYSEFINYEEESSNRDSKIYVPIDCKLIAEHFSVDRDVIFGRLYYHLENKYGYKQDDDISVHFFAIRVGNDSKCINFPYLASILANLRNENKKFKITTFLSIVAIIMASLSLGINVYTKLLDDSSSLSVQHITKQSR